MFLITVAVCHTLIILHEQAVYAINGKSHNPRSERHATYREYWKLYILET